MIIERPTNTQGSVSMPNTQNTSVSTVQPESMYANSGFSSFGRGTASVHNRQVTVDMSAIKVCYQNFGVTRSGEVENPYDALRCDSISQAHEYTGLEDTGPGTSTSQALAYTSLEDTGHIDNTSKAPTYTSLEDTDSKSQAPVYTGLTDSGPGDGTSQAPAYTSLEDSGNYYQL